jgi:glycyl-tRNA synthetase alpha chain
LGIAYARRLGIGWQVLFDGQEITQFTYFQQAGGIDLAPISVELTYGIERFAMALQDVDNVFDLEWAQGVKYREVRHRDEVEQSKYAFGQIDMPAAELHRIHRELFEQYYVLAETLLRSDLVLPALDYCLKCSHMFNLLDSSGGIGVTEAYGLYPAGKTPRGRDCEEVGRGWEEKQLI